MTKLKLNTVTLLTVIIIFTFLINLQLKERIYTFMRDPIIESIMHGKWRNLSVDKIKNLSNLGRILFLDETPPPVENVTYKILFWKHGPILDVQFIRNKTNPLQNCSVQNCQIMFDTTDVKASDMIVFHLHLTPNVNDFPLAQRSQRQIWVFYSEESPYHSFSLPQQNGLKPYNNIFNWSMTYRMLSDIPIPYGRTIPLSRVADPIDIEEWSKSKKQDVLVVALVSNCGSRNSRLHYINELSRYIKVDFYGVCGNLKCEGHYYKDCDKISSYKFYLSFENSNCDEYITEKVWWSGYEKNTVPIIMGAPALSLEQSLPPNSYIDVNDFPTAKHLADYILHLNTSQELKGYFAWKRYFKIVNEHGYFYSPTVHYCRMCEALNYNNKEIKIYGQFEDYFNLKQCTQFVG